MKPRTTRLQRATSLVTAATLLVTQVVIPPRAQAVPLGSATASAGSAPPPNVSAIQSFQPDLFTGRATTSIPIAVPPGRKGVQPSLALSYSSSGRNSWIGVGWGLDVGTIERSTKNGVPKYSSADTFTFMFQGVSSDLVQIPDGTYRAKDEGLFLRFENKGAAGWEVRDKSGARCLFGQTAASQIESAGKTFRWALDKVIDVNGNSLTMTYAKDQGQLYFAQILYTAHASTSLAPANQVDVILESRPDVETSYRAGFPVTTAKRLKTIETRVVQVGGIPQLARRYSLAYALSPRTGRSLLTSVTQTGSDGTTSLPSTTFTYTDAAPNYLHCHNCVPSISSGNRGWQLQTAVGQLFPVGDGGNDQRLWPSGAWEPGVKTWSEKVCRRVLFGKSCHQEPRQSAIPAVSWGPMQLALSGSTNGITWSTDASGNLSISGPIHSHLLAMTWLYTATSKTVSLSSLSTSGRSDVFYVVPNGSAWTAASGNQVPLSPGWTVVGVTAYSETGSFSSSMGANLASQVTAMNHAQFSPMGLTGDFNGDGYADLAHLDAPNNHWHVMLNSPSGFGQEQTWLSATLPSQTVPLVGDADSDGKSDLILWNTSTGLWQVAKSTGSSFAAPSTWHSGFGAGQTPFMGDFNGDQLLDVGAFSGGTWTVALSNGSSFGSATTWLSGFGSGASPLTGDFNGDGLTDVAAASNGALSVALSTGSGFVVQGTPWTTSFGAGQSVTSADVTGDGLTDVLYYDRPNGTVILAPSTGQAFGAAQTLMSAHPFGLRTVDDTLQVGDFRGNGMSGFGVFNALTGAAEIAVAMGTPPDLLEKTANGLGGATTLTYQPSSELSNTSLPFAMSVVSQAVTSDGLGSSYSMSFRYAGGRYDAPTKEFRGFQTATVTDAAGTTTTTTFAQDLHAKGRPLTAEVRDSAGRLFTKMTNAWGCVEPFAGVHFTRLEQTDSVIYDGDASFRQVRSRFSYDQYGNMTQTNEDGQVDPPLTGDERTITTTFVYNPTAWIVAAPSLMQTLNASGTIVAQRRFYYDGSTSITTAPTLGRLTKEEEWLNLPTVQWLATSLTYDAYGNVKTVTDALGRTTTNTYDASGTYLTQVANVLGHTRQLAYDVRTGQVTSSTDQNGQVTTTEYDALGRVTKVVGPADIAALPTLRYTYTLPATPPSKTTACARVQSGQSQEICTDSYADGLGRTIQTRAPAENPAKHVVTGAAEFDARGLVIKQWAPYLDAVSTSYVPVSLVSGLAPPVSYTYDAVGRLIETTDPDGSKTLIDYHDGNTTTTLASGTQTAKLVDVYGRLIQVAEVISETTSHVTTYVYDALGHLTQVTDARGNITRISYDSLGRKLSMDDPDMGRWTYAYDAVDNLSTQTDARGVTISFTYDALNRLTQKAYAAPPASTIQLPAAVVYTYDDPFEDFSQGKLIRISDGSGSSSFEYDRLGRLIRESKTIDATTYTIQRSYDLLGRLTSLTYPDNDVATYTYNPQGGIETVALQSPVSGVTPIVSDIAYNAAGQLTKIVYGNGTVSDYTYHPQTLRLDQLKTTGPAGTLQNFNYAFDAVGNVTGITDHVNTGTQSFQYDALNRLTQATGSYGNFSYAYDPLGNMTSKEGAAMTYGLPDGTKPHAVMTLSNPQLQASDIRLSYDANGNVLEKAVDRGPSAIDWAAQRLQYDAENRLVEVQTAPEQSVTLTFQPGWNFFSLPVIPNDARVSAVLSMWTANFEQLSRYEPATNTFTHYVGNAKFDDFTTFEYGVGYQVYCKATSPVTMTVTGKLPTKPFTKSLALGWHLLGPTPLTTAATSTAFTGLTAAQVLSGPTLTAVTQVQPGQSYYVRLTSAGTWAPALPKDPTTRFIYDGDGGRVKQLAPAGTTKFLGSSYEIAPTGITTKYLFAGSQRIAALDVLPQVGQTIPQPRASLFAQLWQRLSGLLAWIIAIPDAEAAVAPSAIRFYHSDHLGSTNLVTNGAGAAVELNEHTPYGSLARHVGPVDVPQKFTGQRLDPSTGLYFYHARYYDPSLARFISPDPFVQDPSDPQTLNRYSYVRNNPINYVDPSGNFIQVIIAAIMVIATVAAVVSIATGVASLVASATGHERAAKRLAKVSQVSAYVSTPLAFMEGGLLVGAAYLISGAAVAAASDPVATAFSGPSFNGSSPTSPLQQTATAVGEYAIGVGATTAAFGALGAAMRPTVPWLKKATGPTLRKFAARWGPKLGKIRFGAQNAAGQTARTGRPFAMGLTNQGLDEFASARGATTWKQLPDPENWKLGMLEKFADPNTPLHFNLDGVDVWQGVARAARNKGGATDWELLQIQQNPQIWERLRFWKNGVPVDNPFQ